MKFISRIVLVAVLFFATASRADHAGIDMSGTSPAAPGTTPGYTTSTAVGMFNTCSFYVVATGATGGTLDIFIQTSFKQVNASPVWVDVAHLPQLAAGAAAASFAFTLTRWSPSSSAITASLNTTSGTPVLAANTVVPGVLGYLLRVVYKAGAGTTVGGAETILTYCSGT